MKPLYTRRARSAPGRRTQRARSVARAQRARLAQVSGHPAHSGRGLRTPGAQPAARARRTFDRPLRVALANAERTGPRGRLDLAARQRPHARTSARSATVWSRMRAGAATRPRRCSAAIDEAFGAGELEEMQACCVPENLPSRAVLNRTGFAEERTIRGGAVIRGRHVDVVLYRMTRSEWRRLAMPARHQMQS